MKNLPRPVRDRQLTPEERIICAYVHFVLGYPQQDLTAFFPVNSGRINEAIRAIEKAAFDPRAVRRYKEPLEKLKKKVRKHKAAKK